jgi:hypothetical protein
LGAVAITGIHGLIYTSEPDALRAVLRDVFEWPYVEDEPGWLIFALPPAELGVHPTMEAGEQPHHQLSFMCDDLSSTMDELRAKGVVIRGEPQDQGWGIVTTVVLPGDVDVMLYEPRHRTAGR